MALLDRIVQARFDYKLKRLKALSTQRPFLPEPHCSALDDELWALDCPCDGDSEHYVVIYAIYGTYCVVLHAYPIGGETIEQEATRIARERWADCVERISNGTEPSPFGGPVP